MALGLWVPDPPRHPRALASGPAPPSLCRLCPCRSPRPARFHAAASPFLHRDCRAAGSTGRTVETANFPLYQGRHIIKHATRNNLVSALCRMSKIHIKRSVVALKDVADIVKRCLCMEWRISYARVYFGKKLLLSAICKPRFFKAITVGFRVRSGLPVEYRGESHLLSDCLNDIAIYRIIV